MITNNSHHAVILGCEGLSITSAEAVFFRDADPVGFILFARNCDTPAQIQELIVQLRSTVGREAPVLIDQEGGRVQRLKPPYWRKAPAADRFAKLASHDAKAGTEAAYLNARLMAEDLIELGITVNCTPVLDVPQPGAHSVIGDRAYGTTPAQVIMLGRAVCEGTLDAQVLPVIKHIPGHGRSHVDSHKDLPVVDAAIGDLETIDFEPFRGLSDMPIAMTAHIVYTALDPDAPATSSKVIIENIIRQKIGFDGLLVSDDLSMEALQGGFRERAEGSLLAGCDLVLHCNGKMQEMVNVLEGCCTLSDETVRRYQKAEQQRLKMGTGSDFDRDQAESRLSELLDG